MPKKLPATKNAIATADGKAAWKLPSPVFQASTRRVPAPLVATTSKTPLGTGELYGKSVSIGRTLCRARKIVHDVDPLRHFKSTEARTLEEAEKVQSGYSQTIEGETELEKTKEPRDTPIAA